MVNLLAILGTIGIGASSLAPTSTLINNAEQQTLDSTRIENSMSLNIKNEKFNIDGNFTPGIQSYKDEMTKFINEQREIIKSEGIINFKITDGHGQFPQTEAVGNIKIAYGVIEKMINAKEFTIGDVETKVGKLDEYGNYEYSINISGTADGNEVKGSLYSYQPHQSLTDFQILGGYVLSFETEYTIGDSIDHTDKEFASDIQLPNLGINFYAHQVIDMFNFEGNNLKQNAIDYINKTLDVKIINLDSIEVFTAIKDGNEFTMGDKISNDTIVEDEFFYVSFTSVDAGGTFNMVVKNV